MPLALFPVRAIGPAALALLLAAPTGLAAPPQPVGAIVFAKGSNAAQQPGQAPRILGPQSAVYAGDIIETAERSFVVVEFIDGAKISVRPNSRFNIQHYQAHTTPPKAALVLHQGGLRAKTGAIAQQHPEQFQIKADQTTIKGQQADYAVRICDNDCQPDPVQPAPPPQPAMAVVARVADLKGEVHASRHNDPPPPRRLSLGAPVYSTDTVVSGSQSHALLVFRDGEKITVQENSELTIADYRYQQPGQADHAFYKLTTGGMRVLTGQIGKAKKDAFAIDTPVGIIGIRGTGFDLACQGDCVDGQPAAPAQPALLASTAEGLYSQVWKGEIVLANNAGEFVMTMPQSHYTASRDSKALTLAAVPAILRDNPFPRPDLAAVDGQQLFAASAPPAHTPDGVYVAVREGHVQLSQDGQPLHLGAGEAAHSGHQQPPGRLATAPPFQQQDAYLWADLADPQMPAQAADAAATPGLTGIEGGVACALR